MSDFTYLSVLFNVTTVLFCPLNRNLTEKSHQLLWLTSPFLDPALVEWKSISSHDSVSLMVGSDWLPSPMGRDWNGLPQGVWGFSSGWDGWATHIKWRIKVGPGYQIWVGWMGNTYQTSIKFDWTFLGLCPGFAQVLSLESHLPQIRVSC